MGRLHKMKTEIREIDGKDVEFVLKTILDNNSIYGAILLDDLIASRFNGIYLPDNKLVGFYATCSYLGGKDIVICYVYILEEYRRKGLFNKIVNRVKCEYNKADTIGLWASMTNSIANKIYGRKFTYVGNSTDMKANYYLIENRKKFE